MVKNQPPSSSLQPQELAKTTSVSNDQSALASNLSVPSAQVVTPPSTPSKHYDGYDFISMLKTVKWIADRMGVGLIMGGGQAYTDGLFIVLPNFSLEDPHSYLAAKALLTHEMGHFWFSNFEVLRIDQPPLLNLIFNVLEDVRVDHLMCMYSSEYKEALDAFNGFVLDLLFKADHSTFPQLKVLSSFILSYGRSILRPEVSTEHVSQCFQQKLKDLFGQEKVELLTEAVEYLQKCDSSQTTMQLANDIYSLLAKDLSFIPDYFDSAVFHNFSNEFDLHHSQNLANVTPQILLSQSSAPGFDVIAHPTYWGVDFLWWRERNLLKLSFKRKERLPVIAV